MAAYEAYVDLADAAARVAHEDRVGDVDTAADQHGQDALHLDTKLRFTVHVKVPRKSLQVVGRLQGGANPPHRLPHHRLRRLVR